MDFLVESTNIYKEPKYDTSTTAVKSGVVKSVTHGVLLLITVIVLSAYYGSLVQLVRHSVRSDPVEDDMIPFSDWFALEEQYRHDSQLQCECSHTTISLATFSNAPNVIINEDDVCNSLYLAYYYCDEDDQCAESVVGDLLFARFGDLCISAQSIYSQSNSLGHHSVTSSRLWPPDDLDHWVTTTADQINQVTQKLATICIASKCLMIICMIRTSSMCFSAASSCRGR